MRPQQRSEQRSFQRFAIRTPTNRFNLDENLIPPNMTYEWKRKTIMGMEDVESQINYEANGWTPVPPDRHPELMGLRKTNANEIVRGGLVLMQRPVEITSQVQELEEFAARNQVAMQLQRLRMEGKRAAGRGIKTDYQEAPAPQRVPDDL